MKRIFGVIAFLVVVWVAVFIYMRTTEPSVPSLPAPVTQAPRNANPQTAPMAPGMTIPAPIVPVQKSTAVAEQPSPFPQLDDLLAQAKSLTSISYPEVLVGTCRQNPLLMAQSLGFPLQSALPAAASMLCARDASGCDKVLDVVATHRKSAGLPVEPIIIDQREGIPEDMPECQHWAAKDLYGASVLDGHPDPGQCLKYMDTLNLQLNPDDVEHTLCPMMARDFVGGGNREVCRWLAGHMNAARVPKAGRDALYKKCMRTEFGYVDPHVDCSIEDDGNDRALCRLAAAKRANDPGLCKGDALCLGMFQGADCDPSHFPDLNPEWKKICPTLSRDEFTEKGQEFVNTYPQVRDALVRCRSVMPKELTAKQRRDYEERIAQAIDALKRTNKKVTAILEDYKKMPLSRQPTVAPSPLPGTLIPEGS